MGPGGEALAGDGAHLPPDLLCAVPWEKGLLGPIWYQPQNQQPVSEAIIGLGDQETFSLLTPIANSLCYY